MSNPVPVLVIQTGKHKGKKIRLSQEETLAGRSEEAKIRIASSEVSREHCMLITSEDGSVIVRDMGSRNGTFIDGRPVQGERPLPAGATLTIGPLVLQLLGDVKSKDSQGNVRVAGKATVSEQLSDYDIASWLSDDSKAEISSSDTAIIQKGKSLSPQVTGASMKKVEKKPEFKSIAEEAQDIIRRHFESLESTESHDN